jgi:hypothetical protein
MYELRRDMDGGDGCGEGLRHATRLDALWWCGQVGTAFGGPMANDGKAQCPTMVNFNRRCIRAEGHAGPCGGGLKSPRVGVFECGFCRATFPSLEEFDAHAPCPAAT